jgi:hypothetical protein
MRMSVCDSMFEAVGDVLSALSEVIRRLVVKPTLSQSWHRYAPKTGPNMSGQRAGVGN